MSIKKSSWLYYIYSWVFVNFTLADELFAKPLRNFGMCLPLSNNLCGKLVSPLQSPIIFDDSYNVTSVAFFISDFSL